MKRTIFKKLANVAAVSLASVMALGIAQPQAFAQYPIGGRILEEYNENRNLGFNYGATLSGEKDAARGGKFQEFSNANIYWHDWVSNSHANTVGGAIFSKWGEKNWEWGDLKYPTTREIHVNGGAFNHFEGGSIYFKNGIGAHIVWGAIRQKWFDTGAETNIGFPVTDEVYLPRYNGRYNAFENGSIYWSAASGTHIVRGAIMQTWGAAGYETGNYGYPITDEFDIPGGKRQIFQGGPIDFYWDNRPVGRIKMSTFRWQDFIPEESIYARCDLRFAGNQFVVGEYYNGNNRSWAAEGSFKIRMDANVYVDQANGGAKVIEGTPWIEETVQTVMIGSPPGPIQEVEDRRTAGTEDVHFQVHNREANDYPDTVRFRWDALSTQPFCDAPGINDGIKANFNAGFSGSTGAFWIDGTRRKMPNAEAYIRDWVTPGNGGWKQVGTWVKTGPGCLISDQACGLASVARASSNWNGGSVV